MAKLLLTILLSFNLVNSLVVLAETTKNSVTVAGECRLNVATDRGQLQLNAESLEKDPTKATLKTTEIYNKLKKSLEKLKIEDLQITTSGYQVYEQKDWENNKSVSKGFKSSLGMKVESNEIAKFSEIIKLAGEAGITNVGSFTTFLSLEKQKKLAADCLKVAAHNAKDKAKVLAEELGSKAGKPLMISELDSNQGVPNPPMYEMRASAMLKATDAASSNGPEIGASEQEYYRKVNVTFELL